MVKAEHQALRRLALQDTELARATPDDIRTRLLKVGAQVCVRRVVIALSEAFPAQDIFTRAESNLAAAPARAYSTSAPFDARQPPRNFDQRQALHCRDPAFTAGLGQLPPTAGPAAAKGPANIPVADLLPSSDLQTPVFLGELTRYGAGSGPRCDDPPRWRAIQASSPAALDVSLEGNSSPTIASASAGG